MPFFKIPSMVSNLVQCSVSIKRINQFLNCEDLNSSDIGHEKRAEALVIENGSFSWEGTKGAPILRDINVKVDRGALVAVVGPVGSGKSSLISAFLGEMYKLSGVVNTTGTVAYVPQQAWIQNATIKENITFEEAAKNIDYNQTLETCALKPDLKTLPAGDLTEIGDKGVNLSGGQKQRISLARAVYHEADVYFLDDPLSAVDAHVSKHIFQHVIGPKGLLKKKTRVLVTHNVTYLSQVDFIFVIKEGTISESGTFKELIASEGEFSEFMATYLEGSPESDEEDFVELKEMIPARKKSIISQTDPNVLYRRRLSVINNNGALLAKRRSTIQKIPEVIIEQRLSEVEHAPAATFRWNLCAYYIRSIGFRALSAIIFLNILLQTLSIATNLWLVKWTNNAANDATPLDEISSAVTRQTDFYLLIFALLGSSKCIVECIADMRIRLGCWTSAKILHNSMLRNFFRLPLSFMDVTSSGRILSRFSRDVDVADNTFPTHMTDIFFCTGDVICNLIIVSCSTPIFVTVILPLGLLYFLTYRFYVATSTQLKRLESKSRSEMYSHFVETVIGAQSIRAYGLTEKFINKAEKTVDLNQRSYYPSIVSNRWLSIRTDTISNMTIFFAALFAVLDRDTISPGNAGLSVGYTLQITMLLNWLIYKTSEVETNMVSIERIKEYSEKPQEAAWEMPNESIPKNWPTKGNINFLEFHVRYRNGLELVLRNITFFIRGGQKVGVVGRTGSGKSSLALSLFRILESAGGKILIDGIDIATLGLHTVRSKLTIIPQDPVLFAGSLRMNLDPFQTHTDDKIWNALELAHLKPFVSSLENGLQSEVTEGGENFSVGQRQLICLARALLRKTKILILDEATAAVDLETDDLIQSTIRNEFQHCTVLTIAHRLNTVMDYDKIMVLDNGYMAEYDTPQKLLQSRESMFYKMASDAGLT